MQFGWIGGRLGVPVGTWCSRIGAGLVFAAVASSACSDGSTSEPDGPPAGAPGSSAGEAGEGGDRPEGGTAATTGGRGGGATGARPGTGGSGGEPGGEAGVGGEESNGGSAGAATGGTSAAGGSSAGSGGNAGGGSGGGGNAGGGSAGGGSAGGGNGGTGGVGASSCGGTGESSVAGSTGSDESLVACASSCLDTLGPNPCGAWSCTTTGECVVVGESCADRDADGLGVGSDCACALDCDDNDSEITTSKTLPCCRTGNGTKTCTNGVWSMCSAGIPATAEACDGEDDDCDGVPDNGLGEFTCGIGACRATVPACVGGEVSDCVPGSPTSSVDECNEVDDDCDGAVDEDCSVCLHVAPDGDDVSAATSNGVTSFRNVQPAIDFAFAHPEIAMRVCVAAGSGCGQTAIYPGPCGDLRMRAGVDVLGGYESTTWTRCADSTTRLAPTTDTGVLFPDDIDTPTVLDGFAIDRVGTTSTAGVTVRGARQVTLSNLTILDGPLVDVSYGINVTNDAEAAIHRSRVDGGRGARETVGVRSVGSEVRLEENPGSTDPLGRYCSSAAIRAQGSDDLYGAVSDAVRLDTSPGSRIERSSICADQTFGAENGAALRIVGDGTGILVRENSIGVFSYEVQASGVRMESCSGAAPWIVKNSIEVDGLADGNSLHALSSVGDCHPVIDSNHRIVANLVTGSLSAVDCGKAHGIASRCVIAGNDWIAGGPTTGASRSDIDGYGVRCTDQACTKISRNRITGVAPTGNVSCGQGCALEGVGVLLQSAEALVDRNSIFGGCSTGSITGMRASGNLRIENNVIVGLNQTCTVLVRDTSIRLNGLIVNGERVDVHSNTISSSAISLSPELWNRLGTTTSCSLGGVSFGGAASGVFRNNRIDERASCPFGIMTTTEYSFGETGTTADPSVFEHNSLSRYLDEGTTLADPNNLTDMVTSGNIGSCTGSGERMVAGSACIDAGTTAGAPRIDIDGELRDANPDIGSDEYRAQGLPPSNDQ